MTNGATATAIDHRPCAIVDDEEVFAVAAKQSIRATFADEPVVAGAAAQNVRFVGTADAVVLVGAVSVLDVDQLIDERQ